MARFSEDPLVCEIIDDDNTVTLGELCRSCGVPADWVMRLVAEGVLEPAPDSPATRWTFAVHYLPRVHRAARLQRDLGLNASGLALTLDLMDEIHSLRSRLDALDRR